MRLSAIYFAIFTLGANGALAQGVSSLPVRQAPIGHRQPTPSALPPDVRKDEQRSSAPSQSPSLVSVAKLVDSERGQVSYADFIGTTSASRGWICKRFSRHFRCGSTFQGAVVRGVAMRTAVCFAASPVS
jgi:hypothetical protein